MPNALLSVSALPDTESTDSEDTEYSGKKYTLTVGSYSYDQDSIANVSYSQSAPNHGMYGIAAGCISADIYTGAGSESDVLNLNPNTEVTFSDVSGITFILTSASFQSKGVVTISAYSEFVNADIPMNTDTIDDLDTDGNMKAYSAKEVCKVALGTLFGTAAVPSEIPDYPYLYYTDYYNKTVREVLEEISKVNGGYFSADRGAKFRFSSLGGDPVSTVQKTADEFSDVSPIQTKTINSVFVTDSDSGNIYCAGTGSSEYYNTYSLKGSYLFGSNVCLSAGAKLCREYSSWSCDNILVDDFVPTLHMQIDFAGASYIAEKFTVKYTKNHSVMSAGADSFQLNYADYSDERERAVNLKIGVNTTYGTSGIDSSDGIYFSVSPSQVSTAQTDTADTGRTEKYYFGSVQSGGFTSYDGVISSAKEASSAAIDTENEKVTVTYADGHIYTYSATVAETDTGFTITDESEAWE